MRNHKPGSIQAAVSQAYRAAGGLEEVSDCLGLSESALSEATQKGPKRPHGLGVNYLDRLARMKPEAAAVLAQHFAALAGGTFQPVASSQMRCLMALVSDKAKESGDSLSASIRVAQSGGATPREIDDAIRELDEQTAVDMALRAELVKLREGGASPTPFVKRGVA